MKNDDLINTLEAVIFANGEPLSIDRIANTMELSSQKCEKLLVELQERYVNAQSGLQLVRLENAWQLTTKKKYADYIKRCFDIKRKTPLSTAALEVLSVIAYKQPVTKSYIETVRGVDCSGVMSTLLEKELIEECGRLDLPGRPLIYGTTKNFLRCFGLSDLSELPSLPRAEDELDIGEQLEIKTDGLFNEGDNENG